MGKDLFFKNLKGKWNTCVTVAAFLIFIFAFTVASIVKPDRNFSSSENRYLAQRPKLTVKEFFAGTFSEDYEEYITDQFVGRDSWISIKTVAELSLGKKDINGVYIGKDDYLIEMHDDIDEEKAYSNADRMIAFLNEKAKELGSEHVSMMIVPTAVEILDNKLPAHAQSFNQMGYIDYMKQNMEGTFIDVSGVLMEHKDEDIYYRTDHHWTTYGAYLAYREWADALSIKPYEETDFRIEPVADDFLGTLYSKVNYAKKADTMYLYQVKGDISYELDFNMGMETSDSLYAMEHLETKDKYSVFLNGNNSVVTIDTTQGRQDGKTLLIIKDSYAHCFIPFVANHYERVVVIDLRYLKMPISQVLETYKVTDILVLYNAIHFAKDTNMSLIEK